MRKTGHRDRRGAAMISSSRERVLRQILEPIVAALNEEAARKLADLQVGVEAQARIDELGDKCNEGELTAHERAEYESYVLAGEFVAILRAQSRLLVS